MDDKHIFIYQLTPFCELFVRKNDNIILFSSFVCNRDSRRQCFYLFLVVRRFRKPGDVLVSVGGQGERVEAPEAF
jgi:hypothetical protein